MRFKLSLQPKGLQRILPINYQYEFSSWIYKTIHFGNPEFSAWLHNHGYMDGKKQFRFFTFSNLITDKYNIRGDRFEILADSCVLTISFYAEEAVEPFIVGLFKNQEFGIGDKISQVQFRVASIEKLPEPLWKATMDFRTQSPVVVSIKENESSGTATYLSPDDARFEGLFIKNLFTKFITMLNQQKQELNPMKSQPHEIMLKVNGRARSKIIRIKTGTPEETLIKGFLFDFSLTAPVELMRLGYYAGFGEKNSLGFGSGEVVKW